MIAVLPMELEALFWLSDTIFSYDNDVLTNSRSYSTFFCFQKPSADSLAPKCRISSNGPRLPWRSWTYAVYRHLGARQETFRSALRPDHTNTAEKQRGSADGEPGKLLWRHQNPLQQPRVWLHSGTVWWWLSGWEQCWVFTRIDQVTGKQCHDTWLVEQVEGGWHEWCGSEESGRLVPRAATKGTQRAVRWRQTLSLWGDRRTDGCL